MKNYNHVRRLLVFFAVFAGIFGAQQHAQAQRSVEVYKIREARAAAPVRQQLESLRNRLQARNKKFRVGYTYALERGVKNVAGGLRAKVSPESVRKQNALSAQLLAIDEEARRSANIAPLRTACSANSSTWDWRREGKVPPVRKQKCLNCWAYASVAAYEVSYLIRNNLSVNGSEQYVVSNNDNKAGICEDPGGYAHLANEFLVTNGTTSETIMPDQGVTGTPDASIEIFYNALTWGWADPDNHSSPSAQKIKESVCKYGAVASWIDAGGSFDAYIGGDDASTDVYDDDDNKAADYTGVVGHFISIIGWDDARGAWLVRNSWGTDWGFNAGFGSESGYGWVKQGTHSIGTDVSWVLAPGAVYPLPQRYYDLMPMKRRLIKVPTPINRPPAIRIRP